MKKRFPLTATVVVMVIAALACGLPWQEETAPVPTVEIRPSETPEDSATEPAVEAGTSTSTIEPSLTATEEISPTLPTFPNPVIFELGMFTPEEGWAVTQDGNHLLKTNDGGETWLDVVPSELYPLPEGFAYLGMDPFFLDEETAWFSPNALGNGTLYHTQNGGVNWVTTDLPFDRARYFFLNINDGYALVDLGAGAGSHYIALYRTEDGGSTWSQVFSHEPGESKSLPESGSKSGITFLDVDHGWIGGTYPMTDYFYLHFTEDGGATWAQETDISLPAVYDGSWLEVWQPIFVSDFVGYLPVRALAPDDNTYLLVYRSDDSGQTWTFQNSVQDGRVLDFYAVDAGWVAASTSLFQTSDGGASWNPITISSGPVGELILAVDFVDAEHGWIIATPDDETWIPRKLYRTSDGGMNWTQLVP